MHRRAMLICAGSLLCKISLARQDDDDDSSGEADNDDDSRGWPGAGLLYIGMLLVGGFITTKEKVAAWRLRRTQRPWRRAVSERSINMLKRVFRFVQASFQRSSQRTAALAALLFILYLLAEKPKYGGRLYGLFGIPQLFTKFGWAIGELVGLRGRFGLVQAMSSAGAVYVFVRLAFWCFCAGRQKPAKSEIEAPLSASTK